MFVRMDRQSASFSSAAQTTSGDIGGSSGDRRVTTLCSIAAAEMRDAATPEAGRPAWLKPVQELGKHCHCPSPGLQEFS